MNSYGVLKYDQSHQLYEYNYNGQMQCDIANRRGGFKTSQKYLLHSIRMYFLKTVSSVPPNNFLHLLDRCLRHRGGEPNQAPEFHAGAYFV